MAPTGALVFIGHSMGGMTILELGRIAPELFGDRILGVGLISTSAGEIEAVTLGATGHRGADPSQGRSVGHTDRSSWR